MTVVRAGRSFTSPRIIDNDQGSEYLASAIGRIGQHPHRPVQVGARTGVGVVVTWLLLPREVHHHTAHRFIGASNQHSPAGQLTESNVTKAVA